MPFVVRDADGAIVRVTVREIPGAQFVPHGDADLIKFMAVKGVDIKVIEESLAELRRTDMDMSRAVEDVITALLRKNILKMGDLPKAVQDRIALRVKMRVQIAEAYDRASNKT